MDFVFSREKTNHIRKVASSSDVGKTLLEVSFDPLEISLSPVREADAPLLTIRWGEASEVFSLVAARARSLGEVRSLLGRARERAEQEQRHPLVAVPYLSDSSFELLQRERVSGLDLSGNGYVEVPGRWHFLQRGFPNKHARQGRSREPYRGKSALVARVLLAQPLFDSVTGIHETIQSLGGTLSLSQVSKVLKALENDLMIRRTDGQIRLLQPEKLLDALVESYQPPEPAETLEARAVLDASFYADLQSRAADTGVRVVGYDPQRYVIAPETSERLVVYVEPVAEKSLAGIFGLRPAARFANVVVQAVEEPGVYFDRRADDGFCWCSPLEVYLELMQGGKREKEVAGQLRSSLLAAVS